MDTIQVPLNKSHPSKTCGLACERQAAQICLDTYRNVHDYQSKSDPSPIVWNPMTSQQQLLQPEFRNLGGRFSDLWGTMLFTHLSRCFGFSLDLAQLTMYTKDVVQTLPSMYTKDVVQTLPSVQVLRGLALDLCQLALRTKNVVHTCACAILRGLALDLCQLALCTKNVVHTCACAHVFTACCCPHWHCTPKMLFTHIDLCELTHIYLRSCWGKGESMQT